MDGERTGDVLVTYGEPSGDVLVHHGVKGMKWGIRKDRSSGGSKKKKKKKTGLLAEIQKTYKAREKAKLAEAEAKRAANTRNVTIGVGRSKKKQQSSGTPDILVSKEGRVAVSLKYPGMSDAELRMIVNRLNTEAQLSKLTTPPPVAKKKFSDTLKQVSTVAAKSAAVIGVLGGAAALGKKYGLTEQQTQNLEKTLKILEIIGK